MAALTAGLSISITGKYSRQGVQALHGAQLWAESAGATLILYDDASLATRAVENVQRLIEEDRVQILFGPYSSGLALTAAKIAEQHRRIMWNHGGASDDIVGRWVVSTSSPASRYFAELPAWVNKNAADVHSIVAMHSARGTFAAHVARGLAEQAAAFGLSIELLPMGEAAPLAGGMLVLAGSLEAELEVLRSRPAAPIVAAVSAGVAAFHAELGPLAEGVIGPSQWEPSDDSEWFVSKFKERFGTTPEYPAAAAFATGLIVEECLRRSGSLDDWRLREAAAALDYRTFFGRFRMDSETGRQTGHEILLVQWRDGHKTVLPCF